MKHGVCFNLCLLQLMSAPNCSISLLKWDGSSEFGCCSYSTLNLNHSQLSDWDPTVQIYRVLQNCEFSTVFCYSIATVLCIPADLNRTIKNEWLESITTVLLSVFTPTNTEDPDALKIALLLRSEAPRLQCLQMIDAKMREGTVSNS
jgi:hypothetical protein